MLWHSDLRSVSGIDKDNRSVDVISASAALILNCVNGNKQLTDFIFFFLVIFFQLHGSATQILGHCLFSVFINLPTEDY